MSCRVDLDEIFWAYVEKRNKKGGGTVEKSFFIATFVTIKRKRTIALYQVKFPGGI